MYKGHFITAYLQREIPMDIAVIGSTPLRVGELVIFTAASGNNPGFIKATGASSEAAALNAATHIVAQSDVTMGTGHVPVENRDYGYSDEVAVTGSAIGSTVPTKNVALFAITDKNDIVVDNV